MIGAGLQRVVVVPRNGYANRLQAWASAEILAQDLDVPAFVIWEPQAVATAPASSLFDRDIVARQFLTQEEFTQESGLVHEEMPRYLTYDSSGVICLAGHDRGEQAFMPDLARMLEALPAAHTLLIIAGGNFHLPGQMDARARRHEFYQSLAWNTTIDQRVNGSLAGRPPFWGLHVRGTDRSVTAPSARQIKRALRGLRGREHATSLFVSADTSESRAQWLMAARSLGFEAWTSQTTVFDRAEAEAGIDAVIDWILLGGCQGLIYPRASSFGAEATVASGRWARSLPLHAGASTRMVRTLFGIVGGGRGGPTMT